MTIAEAAGKAREASYALLKVTEEERRRVLGRLSSLLESEKEAIFEANRRDMARASEEGLAQPLMKRLSLDDTS